MEALKAHEMKNINGGAIDVGFVLLLGTFVIKMINKYLRKTIYGR